VTRLGLIAPILLVVSCFDYSEALYFSDDLSGFIEIDYTVPLRVKSEDSLVSFFLTDKVKIDARYTQLLARPVEIANFSKEIEEKSVEERTARIRYKVAFRNPAELERLLIGRTRVFFHEGKYVISRTIPASPPIGAEASRVSRRIDDLARIKMIGHKLNFLVFYPERYDLFTNQGTIIRPGVQSFSLPLLSTLNSGNVVWTMELKINPLPAVSRRIQ